jgi:hypothetical protein
MVVARLSTVRCIFDSMVGTNHSRHGQPWPPKLRHSPVAWSETVYAKQCVKFVLQNAIGKKSALRATLQLAQCPLAESRHAPTGMRGIYPRPEVGSPRWRARRVRARLYAAVASHPVTVRRSWLRGGAHRAQIFRLATTALMAASLKVVSRPFSTVLRACCSASLLRSGVGAAQGIIGTWSSLSKGLLRDQRCRAPMRPPLRPLRLGRRSCPAIGPPAHRTSCGSGLAGPPSL